MSDPYQTLRSPEHTPIIPRPRGFAKIPSLTILTDTDQVAAATEESLVVYGNGPVYALLGNGNDEKTPGRIQQAKRAEDSQRPLNQPLGLTVPFDYKRVVGIFDTARMSSELQGFMEPDMLTLYVGALGFVRARANQAAADNNYLPPSVVPRDHQGTIPGDRGSKAQVYSPEGNAITGQTIDKMIRLGRLPIMSSANPTGDEEISTAHEAKRFAKSRGLPIFISGPDPKSRGSYTIFDITDSEIVVARPGPLGHDVIRALLHGLPISSYMPQQRRSRRVLHLSDLPGRAQYARGPDLRKHLLDLLGVSS